MKLRTKSQRVIIEKTDVEGNVSHITCELLTPKELSEIMDAVKAEPRRSKEGDGAMLYSAKLKRIYRTIIDWDFLDEDGQLIPCNDKNKEIVYNFNKALIDEILDECDDLADIRNQKEKEQTKNSLAGQNGSLSPAE